MAPPGRTRTGTGQPGPESPDEVLAAFAVEAVAVAEGLDVVGHQAPLRATRRVIEERRRENTEVRVCVGKMTG
jgi:hypothetical protein